MSPAFLILIGSFLTYFAPILVYRKRYNVISWIAAPAFVVAFAIPVFAYDYSEFYPDYILSQYSEMVAAGGICTFAGVLLGFKTGSLGYPLLRRLKNIDHGELDGNFTKRCLKLLAFGCIAMIAAYLAMGFVPALAEDPLNAKFFRGQYQEAYDRVAIVYRSAYMCLMFATPLAFAFYLKERDKKILLWVALSTVLIALSLTRGALGILIFTSVLLYIAFYKKKLFLPALVLYFAIYIFGSSIWVIFGIFDFAGEGEEKFLYILRVIASGAPDIFDQLSFLQAFTIDNHPYTYGKTFWGGLIPFRFEWNPSVYTLSVTNPSSDVSEIVSGGFRLPPAVWGFTAFGWLGVFLIPLLNGFFWGQACRLLKIMAGRGYKVSVLAVAFIQSLMIPFIYFFNLSLYMIPGVFLMWYVLVGPKLVIGRNHA